MARVIEAEQIFSPGRVHFHLIRSLAEASAPHTHTFFEIFILMNGQMRHIVNGEETLLQKNAAVLIRPADTHGFQREGDGDCCFLNLAFPAGLLGEVCAFLGQGLSPEFFRKMPGCLTTQAPEALCARAEQVYREYCLLPPGGRPAEARAKLLIAELLERCFLPAGQTGGAPDWFLRLEEAMRQPEVFAGGLQKLAELSGKTPEHICRTFRRYRGKSPHAAISELRAVYAANLLRTTSMPVLDISLECGYTSLSHFYSRFRAAYGVAPAAYRARSRALSPLTGPEGAPPRP